MSLLPLNQRDILINILFFLDSSDAVSAWHVCRRWREILSTTEAEALWKHLYFHKYYRFHPVDSIPQSLKKFNSWQQRNLVKHFARKNFQNGLVTRRTLCGEGGEHTSDAGMHCCAEVICCNIDEPFLHVWYHANEPASKGIDDFIVYEFRNIGDPYGKYLDNQQIAGGYYKRFHETVIVSTFVEDDGFYVCDRYAVSLWNLKGQQQWKREAREIALDILELIQDNSRIKPLLQQRFQQMYFGSFIVRTVSLYVSKAMDYVVVGGNLGFVALLSKDGRVMSYVAVEEQDASFDLVCSDNINFAMAICSPISSMQIAVIMDLRKQSSDFWKTQQIDATDNSFYLPKLIAMFDGKVALVKNEGYQSQQTWPTHHRKFHILVFDLHQQQSIDEECKIFHTSIQEPPQQLLFLDGNNLLVSFQNSAIQYSLTYEYPPCREAQEEISYNEYNYEYMQAWVYENLLALAFPYYVKFIDWHTRQEVTSVTTLNRATCVQISWDNIVIGDSEGNISQLSCWGRNWPELDEDEIISVVVIPAKSDASMETDTPPTITEDSYHEISVSSHELFSDRSSVLAKVNSAYLTQHNQNIRDILVAENSQYSVLMRGYASNFYIRVFGSTSELTELPLNPTATFLTIAKNTKMFGDVILFCFRKCSDLHNIKQHIPDNYVKLHSLTKDFFTDILGVNNHFVPKEKSWVPLLHASVMTNNLEHFTRLLRLESMDVNVTDALGNTALHLLVQRGAPYVQLSLRDAWNEALICGVDPNTTNYAGDTALGILISHQTMHDYLLEYFHSGGLPESPFQFLKGTLYLDSPIPSMDEIEEKAEKLVEWWLGDEKLNMRLLFNNNGFPVLSGAIQAYHQGYGDIRIQSLISIYEMLMKTDVQNASEFSYYSWVKSHFLDKYAGRLQQRSKRKKSPNSNNNDEDDTIPLKQNSLSYMDISCGTGHELKHAAETLKANDIVGIELNLGALLVSKRVIQEALQKAHLKDTKFGFYHADMSHPKLKESFPELQDRFNLITCFLGMQQSFETEQSANSIFDFISGSLRSGGYYICIVPQAESVYALIQQPSWVLKGNPTFLGEPYEFICYRNHYQEYLVEEEYLIDVAGKHGMKLVEKVAADDPSLRKLSNCHHQDTVGINGLLYTVFVFQKSSFT